MGITAVVTVTVMNKRKTTFIAVPSEGNQIYACFGEATHFSLYETADKKIVTITVVRRDGSVKRDALADMLKAFNIDTVLCAEIDDLLKSRLADDGITLYTGVTGGADEAIRAYLNDEN